ncbi:hypothetical protein F0562_027199 [Nyssa sinensis]|uniref:inositol-pentakisphosphate 2-kinase n=1 Tax=Nyssa sinensis TaxID=561372 RepID=A0A5J5B8S0_9ASTE|nr:hypothetical protein F0562_027199 [Nyssa sinensis]
MDSHDIDTVKMEKAKAMKRYHRLRSIAKLFRVLEVIVAFTIISWWSTDLPTAVRISGEYILQLSIYLFNPHVVFLIGNAIIISLFALSRQNDARSNSGGTDLYDEYIQYSDNCQRNASNCDNETPPPVTAETTENDKQIVCLENAVTQMECDAVDKAIKQATKELRRFERTQSEKLKRELGGKARRELRRSETETRLTIVPSGNELTVSSLDKVETLSNEEFRLTVEAFIAKHQRRLWAQEMADGNMLGRHGIKQFEEEWMEVILDRKDSGDWIYRGEGAANIVLAYTGSSPTFVGKVLRLQKAPRNGSECGDGHSALTIHECLLWKDTKDLVSAPTREIAEQLYVQHVMSPLLGSEYVDAGIRVLVSGEFLGSVENNVLCQRPAWRVDAAKVNTLCDYALLISDHSVFPHAILNRDICISVEIKQPKCGFLPLSRFIAEGNAIKRNITRFRMHQSLKLHKGEISEISEYDPLDMFSGSKDRVHKAIKDLFVTPQNNFRVFLNGSLIFGGLGGGADSTSCMIGEAFEDVLKCVIQADDGQRTTNFLELVAEGVFKSGLLDRLLEVEKLDVFDIEGAIHAYYDVVSQPCMVCRDLIEDKLSDRYASLHSIPLDKSLKIVRDYLIAATAKDLSIMIGFAPREDGDPGSPYSVVVVESTCQSFDYKASFIDLDMKPLKKMERYYKLDQQIVSCYTQMLKTKHQPHKEAESFEDYRIIY